MPFILLTNYYSKNPLRIIEEELPEGFNLILLDKACKKELVEKAGNADYFLAGGRIPIDREVVNAAINLKMIQRTGVGIDKFDLDMLKEKGIPVYVNRGVNSRSVAEHTLMLILSVLRRLPLLDNSVKKGNWLKHELGVECSELYNKTVGLVGLGNIGVEVAKMLQAFGARVIYFGPSRLPNCEEKVLNVSYCSLAELLKEADIISLHCPLNSKTEKMIGSKEIATMKSGSIIINTSRGRLIDEDALINSLKFGHLKGAGLDVYAKEPLYKNSPLLNLDNVVLTPHVGGLTSETFRRMMNNAFQNVRLFEEGKRARLESKRLQQ